MYGCVCVHFLKWNDFKLYKFSCIIALVVCFYAWLYISLNVLSALTSSYVNWDHIFINIYNHKLIINILLRLVVDPFLWFWFFIWPIFIDNWLLLHVVFKLLLVDMYLLIVNYRVISLPDLLILIGFSSICLFYVMYNNTNFLFLGNP